MNDDEYPMQTWGAAVLTQQRLIVATVNLNHFGQKKAYILAKQIADAMNAKWERDKCLSG